MKIYEYLYAQEKSPKFRQQYALKAGLIGLDKLQNKKLASEWLQRADLGGVDDTDLRASMLLIDIDRKDKDLDIDSITFNSIPFYIYYIFPLYLCHIL